MTAVKCIDVVHATQTKALVGYAMLNNLNPYKKAKPVRKPTLYVKCENAVCFSRPSHNPYHHNIITD